jgi:EAL domain-containing protein (putative c-di-GMP-specific phosphodiesterase class I)
MPVANSTARVTRSRTVLEDTSLAQREQIWFEITEALMKDFDREIEANIRQYMAPYIR